MVTSKPIGTISYNSPNYLLKTLEYLIDTHRIDDYRIIFHYAEDQGLKDHFHVWLSPAKKIDTQSLEKLFDEPDPFHPDLPLSVRPFRSSEPLNWILYVLHDKEYLQSHPSTSVGDGKIEYSPSDIVSKVPEYFSADYLRAFSVRTSTSMKALQFALSGQSFAQIMAQVPNINPSSLNAIMIGIRQFPS